MYYEVHGSGDPLLLIHGSLSTISGSFGDLVPRLAQRHTVVAPELQAHGHTRDVERAMSLSTAANDIASLVRNLELTRVDVLGYSLGARIAMHLAEVRPALVQRLVLVSPFFRSDGLYPDEGRGDVDESALIGTPQYREYQAVAPDPDGFRKLLVRDAELEASIKDWSPRRVEKLPPTLVLLGDSDIVHPEHGVEMFRLLGGGTDGDARGLPACRLGVLPGTTHLGLPQRTTWMSEMVNEFLDEVE